MAVDFCPAVVNEECRHTSLIRPIRQRCSLRGPLTARHGHSAGHRPYLFTERSQAAQGMARRRPTTGTQVQCFLSPTEPAAVGS
jgi:hypothetical protein